MPVGGTMNSFAHWHSHLAQGHAFSGMYPLCYNSFLNYDVSNVSLCQFQCEYDTKKGDSITPFFVSLVSKTRMF